MLNCKAHDECYQVECRIIEHPKYAQAWVNRILGVLHIEDYKNLVRLTHPDNSVETQLTAWSHLEKHGYVYWNHREREWKPTPAID